MSIDARHLIHGYLDESLSAEQHELLGQWIKSDSDHAREFAMAVALHDRLFNELAIRKQGEAEVQLPLKRSMARWTRPLMALTASVCLLLFGVIVIWQTAGVTPASAAMVELERIIATNSQLIDRTYSISVEETAFLPSRREQPPQDHGRPPKPSIDGALLHVRGPNRFVLRRKVQEGQFFVTGSNGANSWAVKPEGPVRVSADLSRFNRDVPGHEHAMPLSNLHDGLAQLHEAYDVEVMPVESPDEGADPHAEPSRLLVGVKKRGFRGPKRVEITYGMSTGQIRQIRFVEMRYGPERLTLRMTLVDQRHMGAAYFDHESHHDPMRVVEFEE